MSVATEKVITAQLVRAPAPGLGPVFRVSDKETETWRCNFMCMRAPLKGRGGEFRVRCCGFQSRPFCSKNDCQVVKMAEQEDPEVTSSHKHQNYNSLQSNY